MLRSRQVLCGLLAVTALLLSSCVPVIGPAAALRGSGKLATREYPVAGFHSVDVDSAFQVTIAQGDNYAAKVTIDDNLLDYVKVTKEGDTLRIRLDTGGLQPFSLTRHEASITMPDLQGVRLNGASRAAISGFAKTPAFEGDLDGASQLTGDVRAADIRLRANGASHYDLSGEGSTLTVSADGASGASLGKLAVDRADVTLNGASQATVNAKTNLSYNLNGASHLSYSGSPAVGSAVSEGASGVSRQ